jgi:hypothetical protein
MTAEGKASQKYGKCLVRGQGQYSQGSEGLDKMRDLKNSEQASREQVEDRILVLGWSDGYDVALRSFESPGIARQGDNWLKFAFVVCICCLHFLFRQLG